MAPSLDPAALFAWLQRRGVRTGRAVAGDRASGGSQLARELGVSRQRISQWRTGQSRMSLWTADKAAGAFGAHPADIWGENWWRAELEDEYVPPRRKRNDDEDEVVQVRELWAGDERTPRAADMASVLAEGQQAQGAGADPRGGTEHPYRHGGPQRGHEERGVKRPAPHQLENLVADLAFHAQAVIDTWDVLLEAIETERRCGSSRPDGWERPGLSVEAAGIARAEGSYEHDRHAEWTAQALTHIAKGLHELANARACLQNLRGRTARLREAA